MLNPPPRGLAKLALPTRDIRRTGANRFDDSRTRKAGRFGTCYCGFDLETAIAETVLHDEVPVGGVFRLSAGDFASRFVVRFVHKQVLTGADFTGIALKRLGGTGAISTILPYDLPQKWARAVQRHPQDVDGILYMSRHLNDRAAVVLFDRAATKLGKASYTALANASGVARATARLGLTFPFP